MFRSLIALALGTFLLGMAEFSMEGILPDVSRDMAVSIPMAGHIISVYALGVCTGAVFLIILNRVSPKCRREAQDQGCRGDVRRNDLREPPRRPGLDAALRNALLAPALCGDRARGRHSAHP